MPALIHKKPIKQLPHSKRYKYVLSLVSTSTCACGNKASKRRAGIPCCDRCDEWETRYNHTAVYSGRKAGAKNYAGSEQEYRVHNIGVHSNLMRELKRSV